MMMTEAEPKQRADTLDIFVIQRGVHHLVKGLVIHADDRGGCTGGHDGSNFAPIRDAAAVGKDQLAEGGAERQFVIARLVDIARERENLYAGAFFGADG